MPDLNPDGTVALDPDPEPALAHLDPRAVADCELCDDYGYRGGTVCDHVDHDAETKHGRELVQAELAKIAARKAKGA